MSAIVSEDVFAVPRELAGEYPEYAAAVGRRLERSSEAAGGVLPPRIRELVAVAVLAFLGDSRLGAQMRGAIAAGASLRDIVEALTSVATPGGQLCISNGLPFLDELVGELGEAALAPPSVSEKARTGREVSPASPWPWLDEKHSEYQAIRRELNDLTFMPERAALEPRYREILVAAVLSCRGYPTVPQHLRRALAEGAVFGELVEAMNIAALVGGEAVFANALPHLAAIRDKASRSGGR